MDLRVAYEVMYYDLLGNRLCVSKEPGQRGGFVRVVSSKNPEWYSRFCGRYLRDPGSIKRKPRTIIKRRDTLELLERLKEGKWTPSKYRADLEEVAKLIMGDLELSDFEAEWFLTYGDLPEPFTEQF